MNETVTLEGKDKKQWTAVFVFAVILFSVACLQYLNITSDSLARYPYKDENSKALIRQYLTQDEIEYIIEYSIPPNMFIAYIQEEGFSIYHAAEYKKLSESQWDKSPAMIVSMVEETRNIMTIEQLESYLTYGNYRYEDIHYWIEHEMDEGVSLVPYAMNQDVYLDDTHTVSSRQPSVQLLSEDIPVKDEAVIEVNEALQQPLLSLCGGLSNAVSSEHACAGLMVEQGYVSFAQQERAYNADDPSAVKPGHDEHQLGLAVDFAVDGILDSDFEKTVQYQWLKDNAWKYGFIETWTAEDESLSNHPAQPNHFRFIGTELAKTIHDSGLSFVRYKAQTK